MGRNLAKVLVYMLEKMILDIPTLCRETWEGVKLEDLGPTEGATVKRASALAGAGVDA